MWNRPKLFQSARRGAGVVFALCATLSQASGAYAAPTEPSSNLRIAAVVSSADACVDGEEVAFLALVNDHRAASGLRPLALSASLSAAAAYHSADMAAKAYLDHTLLDGTTVVQNMANFGYQGGTHGENLAAGTATAVESMQTWQGSADHNANMLNNAFGVIGIGRAYDPSSPYGWYWTTIFGDVSDGPGWLCGEAAPPSKSASLFQSVDGAVSVGDVNVRTGPAGDYDVVSTLVPNTSMTVTGGELNGFVPVKVDGQFGWVDTEWIERGAITLEQPAAPSQAGTATAIDVVDMRSAPSDEGAMMMSIPAVAVVTVTGEAQDGFLRVVYDGQEGWADAAYLEVADISSGATLLQTAEAPATAPPADSATLAPAPTTAFDASPGAEATTTNNVNLRAQPDAAAPILTIVPLGSAVTLTGSQANGFVNVRAAGQAGWIDSRYLQ